MDNDPVDLDKHRGMAAQTATDIRRVLAEVEANAESCATSKVLPKPNCWPFRRIVPEAAAKARYVLNLYAADLSPAVPVTVTSSRR